jgi:hypothetical protein
MIARAAMLENDLGIISVLPHSKWSVVPIRSLKMIASSRA